MLFTALAKLMGVRAQQAAEPAVIIAIATEICTLARSFPAGTMNVNEISIFAGALGTIAAFLGNAERLEEALLPLSEAIEVLRYHASSDSTGANTSLLLRIGLAHVSAYRALERHSEAAHAMAEVLADCHRPLEGEGEVRFGCFFQAVDIVDHLPMPAFAAEGLLVAVEMSRMCRSLPADAAQSHEGAALLQGAAATSAVLIRKFLNETASSEPPDSGRQAAVLEISACIHFLAEHAPTLLDIKHAEALTFGAGILVAASDLDHALDLNTRAIELYQNLAADRDSHRRPDVGSLVLQGLILSGKHRYEDAVQPLEQALPILLAAGQMISADQANLLNLTLSLLNEAYGILKRDTAKQAMIDDVSASKVPGVVQEHPSVRKPANDLVATLQAAVQDAATDPERGVAALQEVLDTAAGRQDYLIAWAASRSMTKRSAGLAGSLKLFEPLT